MQWGLLSPSQPLVTLLRCVVYGLGYPRPREELQSNLLGPLRPEGPQENGRHGMKKISTGQVRGTNVLSGSEAQSQWEGAVLPGLVWLSPLLRASQAGGGQGASECPFHGTHDCTHPGREGRPWSHPALLPPVGRALSNSISTSKSSTTAPLRNHQQTM